MEKRMIFLCGDLMNNLISEIGKIGSYAAHHRVTRQDIDAVATPQLENQLSMIEVKCSIGARADLGRPTTTALENKQNFMDYLSGLF